MFSKIFSLALFLVPLIICAQPAIPTDTGMVNARVDETGNCKSRQPVHPAYMILIFSTAAGK